MAFCELKYFSKALQKATAANIILPEVESVGPFPVLYLLHGLSDDHTMWQRRTSIERYVQNLPLMVVMPDTGRGFYIDAIAGPAWESAIIKDLIPFIDSRFNTIAAREGRCTAGLSMGGYGAARLALKYPEMFCAAVSHSGAVGFAHWNLSAEPRPDNDFGVEMCRIIGENSSGGPNDLYALADALPPDKRPALRVDCGTEDFLLPANRDFHAHLEATGFPHTYLEFPGAHTWEYWDLHVREAIAFVSEHIGITAAS
jgi:putative tributyrin esterase